jgi:hypothetical protein
MNPLIGWTLTAAALAAGWLAYGWPGVVLAVTCIVFWLLLQFNRAMRVMRMAASNPVGTVESAVMLHSKLQPGMKMIEILPLTRSLGKSVTGAGEENFEWADESGARVVVEMVGGKIAVQRLER